MENDNGMIKHDGLQMMPMEDAKKWYASFVEFSKSILKKDLDYGTIPGTPKPCLYKAGGEKLRFVYGLGVEMEVVEKTTLLEPYMFVDYTYKCSILSKQKQVLAQCEGSCNSMEEKYRWMWITRDQNPGKDDLESKVAIEKKMAKWYYKTDNQKNKTWYFADKLPNQDVVGKKNTIMKMAQKRAFVGAILLATGASEFFTQDLDNLDPNDEGNKKPEPDIQPQELGVGIYLEWREALKVLKTKEEVDAMALQNKEIIEKDPGLRKIFNAKYDELKPPTAKEKADRGIKQTEELLSKK